MDCLRHIEERLDRLILKGHSFMALVDEFREKLAECDAETNRIAARSRGGIGLLVRWA